MSARARSILVTLAIVAGMLGFASASSALGPLRGTCVKVGTGEYRNLWLTADGKCPTYSPKDSYWGPVALGGGAVGPAGPKGDKGDPGSSPLVFRHVTVKLTSDVSTISVTIPGMPAHPGVGAPEITGNVVDSTIATAGATVTVNPVPLASTARTFKVVANGTVLTGDQSTSVTLWILAGDLGA